MGIKSLVKKWIGVQVKETTSADVAVLERSETVFLEKDKKLNEQIEYAAIFNMIQQEVALTGIVLASQYDEELASDVVKVEVSGIPVVITREELGCTPHNLPLMRYVGETIQFQLIEANEANGLVMGSAKKIKEKEFDKLYHELKNGKQFQAKVTKILRYGAYFVIGDISVQMLNKDFAEDHTTIGDVLEIGDTIDVRFNRITENKNLRVEPLVRYKNGVSVSLTELEPNQVVLGTVRSVKKWGVFVRIAPNLDALCSIPSHLAIREGDKVSFRITQVLKEEKRVRGKIVRLIKKD
ncbi:S1 RNA-binding domain-containing protein [Carnobacterium inhibens]|uniref:30S ribosomal protein S1 n=1 Tax=Carnobacterium inhibens subsp. gilichinskyi TaxID=1266845 RepID=U5S9Q9_9LACT|nr:S1 RNA-binding domain-containing protein [Carnobacterium inhibens]AGY81990.1 30S ribosomal protein S1 [Carnobacterium inhibens subsp. gilichinskyi]